MRPVILTGSAHVQLAEALAKRLGVTLVPRTLERFPDGEVHVEVQRSVCGDDVYLVQPTGPPVDGNLLELMLLADACRRDGAGRLTAVVPYLGYARQDRRARGREAIGARLVADLFQVGRFQRIVAVDLHSPSLEGFFGMPVEPLTAVPLLAEALRPFAGEQSVVVAPDLGAAKLADRYGRLLGCPVAVVHKTRLTGTEVSVHGVSGDVRGRRALVVDDMISTGATIEAAVRALGAAGGRARQHRGGDSWPLLRLRSRATRGSSRRAADRHRQPAGSFAEFLANPGGVDRRVACLGDRPTARRSVGHGPLAKHLRGQAQRVR